MEFGKDTWWLVLMILGFVTSAVTYLIKIALFNEIDKLEKAIIALRENVVSKSEYSEDMAEIKKDIREIKANYTQKSVHDKAFDECRIEIKQIKEDYITKDDFLRENTKLDIKLDKIIDRLMEKNYG